MFPKVNEKPTSYLGKELQPTSFQKLDEEGQWNDSLSQDDKQKFLPKFKENLSKSFKPNQHLYKYFGLLLTATILYILSDRKCPYTRDDLCLNQFVIPHLPLWLSQLVTSTLLFYWLIFSACFGGKVPKFYSVLTLGVIIYLGYYYHPVFSRREYGQIVSLVFQLILITYLMIHIIFRIISFFLRKNWKATVLVISSFFLINGLWFWWVSSSSCQHWAEGYSGTKLTNKPGVCKIEEPKVCVYEMTEGVFDLSKLHRSDSFTPDQRIMNQYYPPSPIVGFPRIEYLSENERLTDTIQNSILSRLTPLTSLEDPQAKDLEIFLNKTEIQNSKILIDIKLNQTLVEERQQMSSNSLIKNLLVVYIDALGRKNSFRKLPKTMSWFDKFSSKNDPNMESFQFFRYHALTDFTTDNLWMGLYNENTTAEYDPNNRTSSMVEYFKRNGFVTGYSSDFCQVTALDLVANEKVKHVPSDHEGIAFNCDPQYHRPEGPYGIMAGPYSSLRRGLYGRDMYTYPLEYAEKFWKAYSKNQKLMYIDFLDAHEGTGEVIKYLDNSLYSFLAGLENSKLLTDTTIMLYSDHGLHMHGLFTVFPFYQVTLEKYLPSLFLVLPSKVAKEYGTNIKEKEQQLLTARNVYHTFRTLADKDYPNRDTSVFSNISTGNYNYEGIRTCMCNQNIP